MENSCKVTFTLLDGKKVSHEKINILKEKISKINRQLGIAIIKVGNDSSSEIYVNMKKKKAIELNYNCKEIFLSESVKEEEVIKIINELNNNNLIDGIIIELPLPKHLNKDNILNSISKIKDIDGLSKENKYLLENNTPYIIPCTPLAVLDLLDYYKINLSNKKITIIGKSELVGHPLYTILKNKKLDVELLDSKTINIKEHTILSDIIIIAIGKKEYLKDNMVKKGVIIIDIGINKENNKIYGDVDFNNVSKKSSYITPVPGGIGPMTIYEAMNNLYLAYIKRKER